MSASLSPRLKAPIDILIVEDSPTQARRLQHLLEQEGYRVTTAANGRHALDAAQLRMPTLVLTDIKMPEMDGYELCRRLKADSRLADVPVVLVSTLSDPNDVIQGLECRAENFIIKPYREDTLRNCVRSALSDRQSRRTEQAAEETEIFCNGNRHLITAGRRQIINLLLSTYDAARRRNEELERSQQELRATIVALAETNQRLERQIKDRLQAETRLAQTSAALAAKEEQVRSVVDKINDCVMTVDERGIICSANPATEKVFGYGIDELVGQNICIFLPELRGIACGGNIDKLRDTGGACVAGIGREVEGLHKNSERIAFDLDISEYVVRGKRFFTGILRDTRERRRFIENLQQARLQAEQASQSKSSFLAAMSHEIRTPMNGVIGMLDVLHQSSLRGDQVDMVDLIRESAHSLLSIIEDILDFSKIEANKLVVEESPISVASAVEKGCAMLDHKASRNGADLMLFTDPRIPAVVLGDEVRLRQVVINLVNNALKFSSGGDRRGRVLVRALLSAEGAKQVTVELQVADNGIGMDQQTQANLFTPFIQADLSTTRRFGGTGLGLAIVDSLVKLMGGTIAVCSAPGIGATFSVRLPFTPQPATSVSGAADAEVGGLSCMVCGPVGGLAEDLASYLAQGGAIVEQVADLERMRARTAAHPSGVLVWVIDVGEERGSVNALRAAASARPGPEVRLVVIGRGRRRKPRVGPSGLVTVDGNVLTRRTFIKAVAIAAGPMQQEEPEVVSGTPMVRNLPPSREAALRQGRLILVAEDNVTNQKVIAHQLASLGHAADIAGDGREALERWRSGDYSLLLTDLHMPQMDGYELTAAIRAEEKDERPMPIVALTANAVKGEELRCREVGMNDYLSKPASLAKLKATLEKWLSGASRPKPDATATLPAQTPALAPIDTRVLERLVGNNPEVIREFLQSFGASATKIAAHLREACVAADGKAAAAAAHKLKSSARSVGALALGELCAKIERADKAYGSEALGELLSQFEAQWAAVAQYLGSMEAQPAPTGRQRDPPDMQGSGNA